MVEFVGIALHINVLTFMLFFIILSIIKKLGPELIKPSPDDDSDFGFKDLFTSFRIDYLVSTALVCGILVEFATADWSAIYSKETIGVRGSLATIPYILTFAAMIVARLGQNRITPYVSLEQQIKFGSVIGGVGFIGFILASSLLVDHSKTAAYICTLIGFAIGGFFSAILSPTLFTAANKRSSQPSAVVFAQTGVITLRSSGTQPRNFVPFGDVAAATIHLLELDKTHLGDGLFNVGSTSSCSVLAMAHLVAERARQVLGVDCPIVRPESVEMTEPEMLNYSISKLLATGFSPSNSVDEEIDGLLRSCFERQSK